MPPLAGGEEASWSVTPPTSEPSAGPVIGTESSEGTVLASVGRTDESVLEVSGAAEPSSPATPSSALATLEGTPGVPATVSSACATPDSSPAGIVESAGRLSRLASSLRIVCTSLELSGLPAWLSRAGRSALVRASASCERAEPTAGTIPLVPLALSSPWMICSAWLAETLPPSRPSTICPSELSTG